MKILNQVELKFEICVANFIPLGPLGMVMVLVVFHSKQLISAFNVKSWVSESIKFSVPSTKIIWVKCFYLEIQMHFYD